MSPHPGQVTKLSLIDPNKQNLVVSIIKKRPRAEELLTIHNLPGASAPTTELVSPDDISTAAAIWDAHVPLPPRPPKRTAPARALKEEDYTAAMTTIVQRDYFPDLPRLRAMRSAQIAEGSTSVIWEAQRNLASITPASVTGTPMYGEPEKRIVTMSDGKLMELDLSMRLDDFQKSFTSEDNAAFEALIENDRLRRAQRFGWMDRAVQQYHIGNARLRLAAELGSQSTLGLTDEGELSHFAPSAPVGVLTCLAEPRSRVFFPAEGLVAACDQPTLEKFRIIAHRNTRLPTLLQSEAFEAEEMKLQRENREVAEEKAKNEKSMNVLVASGEFSTSSMKGFEKTPALIPGVNVEPIFTWGDIGSTPMVISCDGTSRPFDVPDQPAKEQMAHKMAQKAARTFSEKKQRVKDYVVKGLTPANWSVASTPIFAARRAPTPSLK